MAVEGAAARRDLAELWAMVRSGEARYPQADTTCIGFALIARLAGDAEEAHALVDGTFVGTLCGALTVAGYIVYGEGERWSVGSVIEEMPREMRRRTAARAEVDMRITSSGAEAAVEAELERLGLAAKNGD